MNRIEYMTKLASLLQDIPEVERRDAMKYYNDYFDEAGEENDPVPLYFCHRQPQDWH